MRKKKASLTKFMGDMTKRNSSLKPEVHVGPAVIEKCEEALMSAGYAEQVKDVSKVRVFKRMTINK